MQTPPNQHRITSLLDRLAPNPPQVLLLEGGTSAEREALALYWAARLNCICPDHACGNCRICSQIDDRVHPDLKICDGSEAKIKIDDIRELKPLFAQPPRGDGKRVVIFHEAQELTAQASNALLKSLEEPSRGTVFVLLAPQREWLLPTLVSRSWTLTLAWPAETTPDPETADWLDSFLEFLRSGKGWFKRTGTKGAVDKDLAMRLILALQRDIAHTIAGNTTSTRAQNFAKLPPERLKHLDLSLAHAQDALNLPTPVNPTLVLDWLATRGFMAVRGR